MRGCFLPLQTAVVSLSGSGGHTTQHLMARATCEQAAQGGTVQRSEGTGTGIMYKYEEDGQRKQVNGTAGVCAFVLQPQCCLFAEAWPPSQNGTHFMLTSARCVSARRARS